MTTFRLLKQNILALNKRQKIILSSVIVAVGLLFAHLTPIYLTYRFIVALGAVAYLLSFWSLLEGLNRLKAVTLLILPTLFTVAVASYYFLLPSNWLIRIPVALTFGLIFYTLLLSQNVFSVASIRTIPLYRAASTTVFILTLITAFLLFNVIFSLNMNFYFNGIAIFLLSFPLVLQMIWSIDMEGLNILNLVYSLIISLIVVEVGVGLSFWPISKSMASLNLATTLFVTLGISTHTLKDRMGRGVVWEYIGWGAAIFMIAALTTSWTG